MRKRCRFFKRISASHSTRCNDKSSINAWLHERRSLSKTVDEGIVTFYSRSKERLWTKGESSGHTQSVVDIHIDCDNDTLLIKVNLMGLHVIREAKVVLILKFLLWFNRSNKQCVKVLNRIKASLIPNTYLKKG